MSGHSKWHNIQKTKGAADAKRSAAFTKIAKEIIVAVKEGGGSGDPNNNSRLATVIAKAKAVNMPNDNIKRTIDKALGAGNTENFEAVTYEGYGPYACDTFILLCFCCCFKSMGARAHCAMRRLLFILYMHSDESSFRFCEMSKI